MDPDTQPPFVIFSLPRSRSAWCSWWLATALEAKVSHDSAVLCSTVEEFLEPLDSGTVVGTCETGAMLGWRLIRTYRPKWNCVVVRRPVAEVLQSLFEIGIAGPALAADLDMKSAMLDALSLQPGVLTINWWELSDFVCAQAMWHFVAGSEALFDDELWSRMTYTNIQIDRHIAKARLIDNRRRLEALRESVALNTAVLGAVGGVMSVRGLQ